MNTKFLRQHSVHNIYKGANPTPQQILAINYESTPSMKSITSQYITKDLVEAATAAEE